MYRINTLGGKSVDIIFGLDQMSQSTGVNVALDLHQGVKTLLCSRTARVINKSCPDSFIECIANMYVM